MTDFSSEPQRCAVILCHPRSDSFCAAAAEKAELAAKACGQQTIRRDLYGMGFDPVMRAADIAVISGKAPTADVDTELMLLDHPSSLVLVYPVWFGSPPALLKGYVERVLGSGRGGPAHPGRPSARLRPELLITIATSAAPSEWLRNRGIGSAGSVFGTYLAESLSIARSEHLALDWISEGMPLDRAQADLDRVATSVTRWLSDQHERWGSLVNFSEAGAAAQA